MAYADFDFYCSVFLGNAVGEEDFLRLAERASDYIRGVTRGASDSVGEQDTLCWNGLRKAVCAVAEVLRDEENVIRRGFAADAAVASETVGSWARSYRDPAVSDGERRLLADRKNEAVRIYLEGLPCFRGVFGAVSYPCLHKRG